MANDTPLRGKFIGKIPNFDGFGAIVPLSCTDEVESWQREKVVWF